ncbi:hypothetical protein [Streptomyces sp. NPDC002889]|uniref:hypothetical protein n=1 Tax=Streptomyces sp. NPDC002889 TaxID=3364669 RepID=UPI0036B36B68
METPLLPITVPRPFPESGAALTPVDAHRVLLHCALDAAGVPLDAADHIAVTHVAELDFSSVTRVMSWISRSSSGNV